MSIGKLLLPAALSLSLFPAVSPAQEVRDRTEPRPERRETAPPPEVREERREQESMEHREDRDRLVSEQDRRRFEEMAERGREMAERQRQMAEELRERLSRELEDKLRLHRSGPEQAMHEQVQRMRGWLEVVDRYASLTRNPTDAGIAAVINANDLLRPRGTQAAIDYFNNLLPQTRNQAVKRAIRLQLVELYRAAGQNDAALEQLNALIVEAPEQEIVLPRPAMPPEAPLQRR